MISVSFCFVLLTYIEPAYNVTNLVIVTKIILELEGSPSASYIAGRLSGNNRGIMKNILDIVIADKINTFLSITSGKLSLLTYTLARKRRAETRRASLQNIVVFWVEFAEIKSGMKGYESKWNRSINPMTRHAEPRKI